MASAESGCYSGTIENGFVATTSCQGYNSRVYCQYYCDNGYVKTATTVYCAGNDKWVPSSGDRAACRKDTDQVSGCDTIFIDNGYVVTCPTSHAGTKKDCLYRCFQGYKPASKSVSCVRNEWLTSDTYSQPCISDGSIVKPTTMTKPPTVTTTKIARTTYPGFYDDPNLKMDVSPVVFVAAVIGGLVVLALLIFTIFFRAHRKTTRDARTRSAVRAACDPLSIQNDYTNNNTDIPVDDSHYRDIARRIVQQSQSQPNLDDYYSHHNPYHDIARRTVYQLQNQQSTPNPPPYYTNSAYSNPNVQNNSSGPFIPPAYTDDQSHDILSGPPSPPYSTVNISGPGNLDAAANDEQNAIQTERTNGNHENITHGINTPSDNPPPYEEVQKENVLNFNEKDLTGISATSITLDPPPPYTLPDETNEV